MKLETIAVHGGYSPDPTTKAVAVPIYQTTAYAFDSTQHAADLFDLKVAGNIYTRIMNPTTDVLEKRTAELEGGIAALAVASGQSAITYAIMTITEAGDNIISSATLYGGTYNLFAHTLPQYGIDIRFADYKNPASFEALIDAKIGMGTSNFLYGPAMTESQCEQALTRGAILAEKEIDAGSNVLAFGEMGIANTSSASCLMSMLCGLPIEQCVGRGTGLNDAGLSKKLDILQRAILYHHLTTENPKQVLATFGGFEIAMMCGAMCEAAAQKTVLLIDGFIATSALLVAAKLQPAILDYCIFAHCSDESGHKLMLEHLGAKPLLNLGLRLGEGTGAALAYTLVQAAVNFLNEMASFESAGVSGKNAVSEK